MSSPEEASKVLVREEYALLEQNTGNYNWETRAVDCGDYLVIFVRIPKPGGRTFLLRLECDDYPRQAPLAQFVDPAGWNDPTLANIVSPPHYPKGGDYLPNRPGKAYPVMCIRGHREYYEGNWHSGAQGWKNPPEDHDRISQLVVNVRNAIVDRWS
ncbi:MAG: hypothetical protein ACYDCL_18710 [Myxococcales bacterium]